MTTRTSRTSTAAPPSDATAKQPAQGKRLSPVRAPAEEQDAPRAQAQQTPPSEVQDARQAPPGARELSRRIRTSKLLSASLKRHWLTVLPHLKPEDRRRLAAILSGDAGRG
ncbi:MAG: hypothetical protein HY332_08940 [Chloroflexi bacterium]|nr:hypothetical protein [Chloroflexota bacterium]